VMRKIVGNRMRILVCGALVWGLGASAATAGEPGEDDALAEAKRHLEKVSQHCEKVRQAEEAKLVSRAWSEGACHEMEQAALETRLVLLEAAGKEAPAAENKVAMKSADLRKELAGLQVKRAKWRVDQLRPLAQVGAVAGRELDQAEAELELARLGELLADREAQKVHGKITPRQYQEEYAKIIQQQAELAHKAAEGKLEHAKRMFEAGRATSLDVHWAELGLSDAEEHRRSAAIEARAGLGEIEWEKAEMEWTSLGAEAAARRVEQLEQIAGKCDEAQKLGLVDEDMLKSCRQDLEQAKEELKGAKNKAKKAEE